MLFLIGKYKATLQEAQAQLDAWEKTSLALSTSKEYRINGQTLTRADANEVIKMINYWRDEVARLRRGGGSIRIVQGIPCN